MKKNIVSSLWVLTLIFLGGAPAVQSQDVFREIDQMKRDISDLKRDVADMRTQFVALRQAILKNVATQDQQTAPAPSKKNEPVTSTEVVPDEKELTNSICQAVGKFFGEVDIALAMSDSRTATERMRSAFHKLNSTLQQYSTLHRVDKLLGIYEGLAWDTYNAVELIGSVQGNERFIQTINTHKQKYKDTCPK